MRIIGGELRGRKLKSLRGHAVRPTSERTREALFDMLGARVVGCRFLDLFAGVGAVGLEALSRGASRVVLVEASDRALRVIRANADLVGGAAEQAPKPLGPGWRSRSDLATRLSVLPGNAATAVRGLASAGAKFDMVFMDPPYRDRRALEGALEEIAREGGILAPGAVVVVEHEARAGPPAASGTLCLEHSRRYGDTALTFYRPRREPHTDAPSAR
ncbi:MAG TPA: 16S rRNA (guanine(966)-N(2))-methyltransferase RsmD [Armatimonadota bacterium]|nr:16S rRNA (guanine(966)-N(2))-methyltransferase RsmD [Armatimonadota bacterium]